MKTSQSSDWSFDFSSLPHWDNRESFPFVYDTYYEIPQSDALCCIYSIAEVTMCNYLGFLAILKNKEEPTLYFNVTDGMNFCDNVSVSEDGRFLFLQPSTYNRKTNTLRRPILILDLKQDAFALFDTSNVNPLYRVVSCGHEVFKVEADETQKNDKALRRLSRKRIKTKRLRWHGLDEWESVTKAFLT